MTRIKQKIAKKLRASKDKRNSSQFLKRLIKASNSWKIINNKSFKFCKRIVQLSFFPVWVPWHLALDKRVKREDNFRRKTEPEDSSRTKSSKGELRRLRKPDSNERNKISFQTLFSFLRFLSRQMFEIRSTFCIVFQSYILLYF